MKLLQKSFRKKNNSEQPVVKESLKTISIEEIKKSFPKSFDAFKKWMYHQSIGGDYTKTPEDKNPFIDFENKPIIFLYSPLILFLDYVYISPMIGRTVGKREKSFHKIILDGFTEYEQFLNLQKN